MTVSPPPSSSSRSKHSKTESVSQRSPWDSLVAMRWPLALVVLALLGFLAFRQTLSSAVRSVDAVGNAAGDLADRASDAVSGFFTGTVTESFISSMPKVQDAGGGRLEVATAEITETFSRSEERRLAWDLLSMGTTTVEIQVPVTYRYHVPLDGAWRVDVNGPVCLVVAPPLVPNSPPAIHTDGLRTRTDESLLASDAADHLAELQRSLTPRLEQRSNSPAYIDLVRDQARQSVASFVRTWLLDQGFWQNDRFSTIKVVFADEPEAAQWLAAEPMPPVSLEAESVPVNVR